MITSGAVFIFRNRFGESEITYGTINYVVPKKAMPTGLAILTNPAVLASIIGGILVIILRILLYRRKKK